MATPKAGRRRRKGYVHFVKEGAGKFGVLRSGPAVAIRKGFPSSRLIKFKNKYGVPDNLLVHVIGFGERTLTRIKAKPETLDRVSSDRLYRLERIFELAIEVFEDEQSGVSWLSREQSGLGGAIPLQLLDTEPGAEAVETLLVQIDNGVLA